MNFAVNVVVVFNRTCLMTLKLNCLKLLGVESCNILKLPVFFPAGGKFRGYPWFVFTKQKFIKDVPPPKRRNFSVTRYILSLDCDDF